MVTFVDDQTPHQGSASLRGDLLCLLSACFYAAYTVAIRRMLPEDESAPMMLFFGYVGLLNLACLAPVLGVLVLLGVVDLRALTGKLLGATVLKGGLPNAGLGSPCALMMLYLWWHALFGPHAGGAGAAGGGGSASAHREAAGSHCAEEQAPQLRPELILCLDHFCGCVQNSACLGPYVRFSYVRLLGPAGSP